MHDSARSDAPAHESEVPRRDAYQVPEVAQLLGGVSKRYVWKLIETGELASFKSGSRLRLVAREDLDEYINRLREDARRAREAAAAS